MGKEESECVCVCGDQETGICIINDLILLLLLSEKETISG